MEKRPKMEKLPKMEELAEELRELWKEQKFVDFLKKVHELLKYLKRSNNDKEIEASKATVEFTLHLLPELSKNENRPIHKYIQEIYSLCKIFEPTRALAKSCNEYVRNVFCTEIRKLATVAGIQRCLEISTSAFRELHIEREQLKVEDEVCKQHGKRNKDDGYKCTLQKVAVEFQKKSPIFPITICKSHRTRDCFPGVYLIYYIGETSLYRKLISHSQVQPIYVGESKNNIFERLRTHCRRLEEAKDLREKDFIVRFIIIDHDLQHYAPSIEGFLQDFYSPLWNDNTAKLYFGNAAEPNNNWIKYHISLVEDEREKIIKRVESYQLKMQEEGPKLTPTPL